MTSETASPSTEVDPNHPETQFLAFRAAVVVAASMTSVPAHFGCHSAPCLHPRAPVSFPACVHHPSVTSIYENGLMTSNWRLVRISVMRDLQRRKKSQAKGLRFSDNQKFKEKQANSRKVIDFVLCYSTIVQVFKRAKGIE